MWIKFRKIIVPGFSLIGLAVWFVVLIPWDRLPDPDAFYHAAMAQLTWEHGPVKSFPWLDLTTLGQYFADQHFLFHVLQGPFVLLGGLAQGSRLSSVFFAVVCMLAIGWAFHKLELKPWWFWTAMLALTHPFSTRLVLGKASPLAILFWFIGLVSVLLSYKYSRHFTFFVIPGRVRREPGIQKEKPMDSRLPSIRRAQRRNDKRDLTVIAVCSLLFALTHGGWIILPGSILILTIGWIVYCIALEEQRISSAIRQAPWWPLVASFVGVTLGLMLHPGRSQLFSLLWTQVIKIGLLTPLASMPMGQEWDPASLGALLAMTSIFGVILLLIIPGLMFAWKKSQSADKSMYGAIIAWGFLVAVLAALTLKSSRYAEYFQPALALWTALLAQLVDWKRLMAWLNLGGGRLSRIMLPTVVAVCGLVIVLHGMWNAYSVLHNKPEFRDDQYLSATQAISREAQPGDRVYHSQWDEFPVLFARDQRLRYIAGLDPNFFYEASSTLATAYFDLAFHAASTTQDQAWNLIHDRLNAKFVMVDTIRWPDLAKLIDSDPRYAKIGEGQGGIAYKLRTNNE